MNADWNQVPHYTHQPFLKFYAERCDKPILELGCGEGSTRMLHDICKRKGLNLVTVENDRAWMARYQDLAGLGHCFVSVDGSWSDTMKRHHFDEAEWGLVFIDQSPWEARTECMNLFADQADYVVIHDVDYFPEHGVFGTVIRHIERNLPGIYDFSKQFATFEVYYPPVPWCCATGPPTLVATRRPNLELIKEIQHAV